MNLIARITLIFAIISFVVFLVGGFITFDVMMKEVDAEQKRFLAERLDRVELRINRRNPTDTITDGKLQIIPIDRLVKERVAFSDTVAMHSQLERMEPHLKLNAIRNVNGRSYKITIYDVIIEPDDIKDGLIESLVKVYLILLVVVLLMGFVLSTYMLRPFNRILLAIQGFSLKEPQSKMSIPSSSAKEFKKLNFFLEEMTNKVRTDYMALKEFSENASHELQTPIAIIQGKLDVLLDSNSLDKEQIGLVSSAQHTLHRLKNLSTSLSVLTKIENNEFDKVEKVDLSMEVKTIIEEFKELIELKSINLTKEIQDGVQLSVDRILCELLLTNLINNAVRHNWENGNIQVVLTDESLTVSNSGADLDIDPTDLFQRFKKSNQSSTSLGLGLAIVQKICDLYDCRLEYLQQDKHHTVKMSFKG